MKNIFKFTFIPFIVIGCFFVVMILPFNIQRTEADEIAIEAEDMPIKTTGGPTAGGWNIWSNGYIAEPNVNFSIEGTSVFNVTAKGSFAGGAWPIMEIRIDQVVVGTVIVDSSIWTVYTIGAYVDAGAHEVAIAFINDYYVPPNDRNLYVDKVNISVPTGGSVCVEGNWYDSDWQFRKTITIDHTMVDGDLIDFPVLIKLNSSSGLADNAQNDGDDILFTLSDSATKLSHEIEKFDGATGELIAWVKVPNLSSTADTILYMYYGNSSAINQENVSNVWDSGYVSVWHLDETSGTHQDSTVNNNDGTNYGSIQDRTGWIDGANEFDQGGSGDYVRKYDINGIRPSDTGSITAEAWIRPNVASNSRAPIIKAGGFYFQHYSDDRLATYWYGKSPSGYHYSPVDSVLTGQWSHVVVTWHEPNGVDFYINGEHLGHVNSSGASPNVTHYVRIGQESSTRRYDGLIDEARVSNIARTAEWIKTQYNNQFSPTNFLNVGVEEEVCLAVFLSADPNVGSLPLNDVDLTADVFGVETGDIHYYFWCDCDSASADPGAVQGACGVADINIPNSPNESEIAQDLCSYGSADNYTAKAIAERGSFQAEDRENIRVNVAVPADGLIAHWQFEEESGLDVYDSTANNNDGILQNSDGDERIDSKPNFGKALDFDGVDDYVNVGASDTLKLQYPMSISTWVKIREYPSGYGSIVARDVPDNREFEFRIYSAGEINFTVYPNGETAGQEGVTSNSTLSLDTWHHVAVTVDASRNVTLYRDGVFDNSGLISNGTIPTMAIMTAIGEGTYGDYNFNGSIDEVRFYSSALSQAEIEALYDFKPGSMPLGVSLSADPSLLGSSPLNDVDLAVNVWGSETGTINYTFYCNCNDDDTNPVTACGGSYDFKITGVEPDGTGGTVEEQGSATGWGMGISKGTILREWWYGISGNRVSNLTGSVDYPDNPTGSELISLFEGPTNIADNYGTRIHGFLHPETTGNYTFWIASDDYSELWLSIDSDPANAVKIAEVPGWTSSRQWDKYSAQKSASISLQAGQKYYIMALQKEGGGGDNIAVGWAKPGESTSAPSEVIPGSYLSLLGDSSFVVNDVCSYNTAGDYTAKVIVERDSSQAEDRRNIRVNSFRMGGLWGHYLDDNSGDESQYSKLYTEEVIENIDFDNFEQVLLDRVGKGNDTETLWTGSIFAETEGWYNFHFLGYRNRGLRFNIYNVSGDEISYYGSTIDISRDVYLTAGWYGIDVRFRVRSGGSGSWIKLFWTPPGSTEEIIPEDHLSPESWSDRIIIIPEPYKPKEKVKYIVIGAGAREAVSGVNIVVDLAAQGISIDDVIKDEVWMFAGYCSNETGHSITNNITGVTDPNVPASRFISSTGWPISVIETKLSQSLIDDGGTGRLDLTFNLDGGSFNSDGIVLLVPYIDDSMDFIARIYIRTRGHSIYHRASPVYLFPVSGDLVTEDIRPFFAFGDGETRITMPAGYRPNYMYYISGDIDAGEFPPSNFEIIQNMPDAIRMMPIDDGPPVLANPLSWYPAFGREGPQMDIISQNYVPNMAPGAVSGGGEIPLFNIDPEDDWIAFQAYSLNFEGDGVIGSGESAFMFGGGIVSTEPIDNIESNSPIASGLNVVKGNYCTSPSHYFDWIYTDPDGDDENQFQFQIDDKADFADCPGVNCEVDRTIVGVWSDGDSNNQAVGVFSSPGPNQLAYNTTYYWQVKVWDDEGMYSDWISGSSFTTELHRWPFIDFDWMPVDPSQEDDVLFADQSTVYGGASKSAWDWVFTDGDPAVSSEQNPIIRFTSDGSNPVTLQITDSDGFVCPGSKAVNIQWKLPDWKEILPW